MGSQGTVVWQPRRTQVIKPQAVKQACTHNERPDQKLWTRHTEGFRFLGAGGNRSSRRKPTKTGMESANQIHIQPLASCIGEKKVYEHSNTKPTRLATGVVCHPDTEQNRPTKSPGPAGDWTGNLLYHQARDLPACHTSPLTIYIRTLEWLEFTLLLSESKMPGSWKGTF